MRGLFPVFIVILGLGASDFAYQRLPGGLVNADRHDILYLAREGAIACFDHAPPKAQSFLQDLYSSTGGRPGRMAKHQHRDGHSQHLLIYRPEQRARRLATGRERSRLGALGQGDQTLDIDRPIEIKFVVPVEEVIPPAARVENKRSTRRW